MSSFCAIEIYWESTNLSLDIICQVCISSIFPNFKLTSIKRLHSFNVWYLLLLLRGMKIHPQLRLPHWSLIGLPSCLWTYLRIQHWSDWNRLRVHCCGVYHLHINVLRIPELASHPGHPEKWTPSPGMALTTRPDCMLWATCWALPLR